MHIFGFCKTWTWARALVCFGIVPAIFLGILAPATYAQEAPKYRVDPFWPQELPNNWIMGQIGGLAVDREDHIWVLQRPASNTVDEIGASLTPPRSNCCIAAPPVLEFDKQGHLLHSWGGPGEGFDWPKNEHGIYVDKDGYVWIGGSSPTDRHILKFKTDGKFVMQIGHPFRPTVCARTFWDARRASRWIRMRTRCTSRTVT